MAINLIVAVTDYDWFQALRSREDWPEVNFWAPSGANFRALQPGELFLFKLHAPLNYIVGGGVFANAMTLPCSLAWEAFGQANGAADLTQMRARILRYRDRGAHERTDFQIGCRVLTQAFFKREDEWLPVPPSWSGISSRSKPTRRKAVTVGASGIGPKLEFKVQLLLRSAVLLRMRRASASPRSFGLGSARLRFAWRLLTPISGGAL